MFITKKCTKCGIEKEISEFHKQKSGKHGRRNVCKLCRTKFYYENVDEILKKNRVFTRISVFYQNTGTCGKVSSSCSLCKLLFN